MLRCNCCGGQFDPDTEPGALAFGPQIPHQTLVQRYNICHACWYDRVLILVSGPIKPLEA